MFIKCDFEVVTNIMPRSDLCLQTEASNRDEIKITEKEFSYHIVMSSSILLEKLIYLVVTNRVITTIEPAEKL